MKILRKLIPILWILLTFLLDTSVLPLIGNDWVKPMLTFTSVISLGLVSGMLPGLWLGLLGGALIDITTCMAPGPVTLLFALAGFFSGLAGGPRRKQILITIVDPAVAILTYEVFLFVYAMMAGYTFRPILLLQILTRSAVDLALVQVFYMMFSRLVRDSSYRKSYR